MNPRNAINFFRSPVGAFVGFCCLVFVALTVANGFKKPTKEKPMQLVPSASAQNTPQLVESVERDMQPYRPPQPKPEPPPPEPETKEQKQPELPPISLFGDTPTTEVKPLSKFYAPYGRLIPCELVITVDSS